MTRLDSNRDASLMQKMCLANELGATYIFISIIGLTIIAENRTFALECEDGLKNESCKKVQFDSYDNLIEYINEYYDYFKIENEFANMEGRIYYNRKDYDNYISLKHRVNDNNGTLNISPTEYYEDQVIRNYVNSLFRLRNEGGFAETYADVALDYMIMARNIMGGDND